MTQTPPKIELPDEPIAMAHIAARVFDTPLLIHEGKLSQILHVLGPKLGFDHVQHVAGLEHAGPELHSRLVPQIAQQQRAKAVFNEDGGYWNVGAAAVIPVIGTLVQRSSYFGALSGLVSYARIERSFTFALGDGAAEEVIFEIDSPGGEVAGAFDLADRIYEARGDKPLRAIATEFAASAAYLLASAADEIVLPRTGIVGSIGVVAAHIDRSKELEKRGVAVTFVYAGEKKVDGNPYQPLPERVRAEWQAEIDEIYGLFVASVARNRGISEQSVRATEAGLFMGRQAVAAGLSDRVNTFANEVHNSAVRRGGAYRLNHDPEDKSMTDAERAEHAKAIAAARDEGIAQGKADAEKGAAEAVTAAVTAERGRIKSIVTCEAAKNRADLATHIAFETDTDAEQAAKLLAAAPEGKTTGQLAAAMAAHGTPGIRTQEGEGEKPAQVKIDSGAIFAKLNEPYQRTLGGGAQRTQ